MNLLQRVWVKEGSLENFANNQSVIDLIQRYCDKTVLDNVWNEHFDTMLDRNKERCLNSM